MEAVSLSNPNNIVILLPGSGRKKLLRPYRYQVSFRSPEPEAVGCVLIWEVCGGNLEYQIALERQETGALRMHCTCADSVYRSEIIENHRCKHIRGLLELQRPKQPLPLAASA